MSIIVGGAIERRLHFLTPHVYRYLNLSTCRLSQSTVNFG